MAGKPGRRTKKSIGEQIIETINDIDRYKESIATLEEKLEDLYKQKREEETIQLFDLMQKKNLSIEQVEKILNAYETEKDTEDTEEIA